MGEWERQANQEILTNRYLFQEKKTRHMTTPTTCTPTSHHRHIIIQNFILLINFNKTTVQASVCHVRTSIISNSYENAVTCATDVLSLSFVSGRPLHSITFLGWVTLMLS